MNSYLNFIYYDKAQLLITKELSPFRIFLFQSFVLQSTWFDQTGLVKDVINICLDYAFEINHEFYYEFFDILCASLINGGFHGYNYFLPDPSKPECDKVYMKIPIEYLIIHCLYSKKINVDIHAITLGNRLQLRQYNEDVLLLRKKFNNVDLKYRMQMLENEELNLYEHVRTTLRIKNCDQFYQITGECKSELLDLPIDIIDLKNYQDGVGTYGLSFFREVMIKANIEQFLKYCERYIENRNYELDLGNKVVVRKKKEELQGLKEMKIEKKGKKEEKKEEKKKEVVIIESRIDPTRIKNKRDLKKQLGRKGLKDLDKTWKKLQLGS